MAGESHKNITLTPSYQIKKPLEERQHGPRRLLIIRSVPKLNISDASYLKQKTKYLSDVIASHWSVTIEELDFSRYIGGKAFDYDAVFVLDEHGGEISNALAKDLVSIMHRNKLSMSVPQVVWAGLNTNTLMRLFFNVSANDKEVAVSSVRYKNQRLPGGGQQIYRSTWYPTLLLGNDVLAEAVDLNGEAFPYAFMIGDHFFVLPFIVPSRYTINDASWVFLDLMHHVLGHHSRDGVSKALLRLEDVNVETYFAPDKLHKVYEYLKSEDIPFHLALIARYIDSAKGVDKNLSNGRRFFHLLQQMVGEGLGTLVQHGYTHQRGDSVSGIGFEFWDGDNNAPLANDSEELVRSTVKAVKSAMAMQGLPIPDIWETPHYAYSALDNQILNTIYPLRYERHRDLGSLPFPVHTDGSVYLPENMGYVSPGAGYGDARTLEDMKMLLERMTVFEDPIASFFWHPWRDLMELKSLVAWFRDAGFQFENVYELVEPDKHSDTTGSIVLKQWRSTYSPSIGYAINNAVMGLGIIVFLIGSLVYILNLLRMKRHLRRIGHFELSLFELRRIAHQQGTRLPKLAIFVPARNEAAVIENTIRQIAALDYPKHLYQAVIIVDEREREDNLDNRTIDVVDRVAQEFNHKFNTEFVHCIEVPKWYSGTLGSMKRSYAKSTKGRALNYALQSLHSQPKWRDYEMIGILDADGRLHPNVLKEVAYKRLVNESKLLQGPVFQVSNFGHVSLIGMSAALELAVHHMTALPKRILQGGKLQFVAGTNYFIDRDVIIDAGGWNCEALVEDAELALRLYVKSGVTAEWLDAPEIEQTPASFSIYRRQRERWVRGHLMLLHDIRCANIPFFEKLYLYNKIVLSQFRFIPEFSLAVLSIVYMFMGYLQDLGQTFNILLVYLLCMAILMFNIYAFTYWALRKYIPMQNTFAFSMVQYVKLFLFFPVFMMCQCVPRVEGLINFARRHNVTWYKTERTQEVSGEVLFLGVKELSKAKTL